MRASPTPASVAALGRALADASPEVRAAAAAALGGSGRTDAVSPLLGHVDDASPEVRAEVFGFHRMGIALGAIVGPLLGGLIAQFLGWRAPFFFFVPPTLLVAYLGLRVAEPGRGHFERAAAGAAADVVETDELRWLMPIPWLAAGAAGLAATVCRRA